MPTIFIKQQFSTKLFGFLPILIILILFALRVYADEITVCATGCDFSTIQDAIDDPSTVDGDTINVLENIHTEQGITVTKDINIVGQGITDTIIQAHVNRNMATDRVFKVAGGKNVTIQNITIQHGVGIDDEITDIDAGGAIFIDNTATLTLQDCLITKNNAEYGAGIFVNYGNLIINHSTITDNRVHSYMGYYNGGGIYNFSSLIHISESTISNNMAYKGGGISNNKGEINISNVTISGNSASQSGGGIYNEYVSSEIIIDNSTIVLNSASSGGGVFVTNNAITRFGHTIISGNNGGNIKNEATINTGYYNLIGHSGACDGSCGQGNDIIPTESFSQIIDSNLSNNGGPTQTHALVPGSPAINSGDPGGCRVNLFSSAPSPYNAGAIIDIDQREANRAMGTNQGGTRCDIGAYEANSQPPSSETPTSTYTPIPPTSTPTSTYTPIPPTSTPTSTYTPIPPTSTSTSTSTPIPPTSTSTSTYTPIPPTSTPTSTYTPVPPTNTPTSTSIPKKEYFLYLPLINK